MTLLKGIPGLQIQDLRKTIETNISTVKKNTTIIQWFTKMPSREGIIMEITATIDSIR